MKTIFFFVSLFIFNIMNAQSHNMGANYNCKFRKGNSINSEKKPCPGCEAKDKKENAAKLEENKKRDQAIWDKAKADKDAKDKAAKAKQLEDAKNAKSGEVYINANSKVDIKNTQPTQKVKPTTQKKSFLYALTYDGMYDLGLFFITKYDQNGNDIKNGFIMNADTIFKNNEFKRCIGLPSSGTYDPFMNNKLNFPPDIGIVILNNEKVLPPANGRKASFSVPIADLIDSKGNRILKDDNITAILHFADDYFILLKGFYYTSGPPNAVYRFDDAEIYNLKTKETITLRKKPYKNTDGFVYISKSVYRTLDYDAFKPYKAFIKTEVGYSGELVTYYINNDGKLDIQ